MSGTADMVAFGDMIDTREAPTRSACRRWMRCWPPARSTSCSSATLTLENRLRTIEAQQDVAALGTADEREQWEHIRRIEAALAGSARRPRAPTAGAPCTRCRPRERAVAAPAARPDCPCRGCPIRRRTPSCASGCGWSRACCSTGSPMPSRRANGRSDARSRTWTWPCTRRRAAGSAWSGRATACPPTPVNSPPAWRP